MKETIIATIFALLLIGSAVVFSSGKNKDSEIKNNVSIENGFQIIEITAKGGYTPRKSLAKAGLPTILRINTIGTFDCSAIVRIPSLNITKNLPQAGITDISLGTSTQGKLNGTCGMGMYPFEISFQN